MLKKIVLPLAILLSVAGITHAQSAVRIDGGAVGMTKPAALPESVTATLYDVVGSDNFAYVVPDPTFTYGLLISPVGTVSAVQKKSLTTRAATTSFSVYGHEVPATVTMQWHGAGTDGAYRFTIAGTMYDWNGAATVVPLAK